MAEKQYVLWHRFDEAWRRRNVAPFREYLVRYTPGRESWEVTSDPSRAPRFTRAEARRFVASLPPGNGLQAVEVQRAIAYRAKAVASC